MTRRACAIALATGFLLGALAFACGGSERSSFDEGPRANDSGGGGVLPTPDAAPPPPSGVVLVHAAAFPSFRLCFQNYPELRPQPDSNIMPNANVVGVEVGSAIRIDPLARAPGKVFVIDRGEVESAPGDEVLCGALICDRDAGQVGDKCLRPGQDYDEIASIEQPLGVDRVELLAITGCSNGIVLSNLSIDPAGCGDGWQFKSGNLSARVLELSPQVATQAAGLPVTFIHLAPMAETVRATGELSVTFGPLTGDVHERLVAKDPPLFATATEQTLPIDRDNPAFYATHGFRIALSPGAPGDSGDASDSDASDGAERHPRRPIVVEQSLAEVQDLSAPRDVPANYYHAESSYVLLLLGDPSIRETLENGSPNPGYTARRALHLLALPVFDPDDARGDASVASTGGPR